MGEFDVLVLDGKQKVDTIRKWEDKDISMLVIIKHLIIALNVSK